MLDSEIKSIEDLKNFRSAPILDENQSKILLDELSNYMQDVDWFTIGIMAPSSKLALYLIKEMEKKFNWPSMKLATPLEEEGPVFLKANQKTGDINVRIEYGLGEGILLGCQHNEEQKQTDTFGPFPLDFFKIKD
ncbi:DUF1824 family protein [Prochlorococcus sp. MIT 1307]|uniref:DUF1824 family protein n=1 Tax=Prochlorococcus sp. MIT 1307 TaxID=3096219 RepID=UPI002A74D8AF|nr:DUF1824 family protein [Prochlorococcus sp. MIT 1307]